MRLTTRLLTTLILVASAWSLCSADSAHPPLLKRAVSPSTIALEIIPRNRPLQDLNNLHRRSPIPEYRTLRYDDSFRLTLNAFGETFHLHLRPNEHLIHPAARINYYQLDSDGQPTIIRTKPLLREDVRAYLGEVIASHHSPQRMQEDAAGIEPRPHSADLGWARIVVHHHDDRVSPPIYEGAFSANGIVYHISTKDNYLKHKHDLDADVAQVLDGSDERLVIWRDSDAMTAEEEYYAKTGSVPTEPVVRPSTCGHDTLEYNKNPRLNPALDVDASWLDHLLNPHPNITRFRRDDTVGSGLGTNFEEFTGQKSGCPTSQRIVYMGVAADCEFVAKVGGHEEATQQILVTWNAASALFKNTINVSLGITALNVQDSTCPTNPGALIWNVPCSSASLNDRNSLFARWRGTLGDDGNGLWHLMSGCPTGQQIGIAWLGALCNVGAPNQNVAGTGVSTAGRAQWQVVAHEIGHNFGAIHDCTETCAQDKSECCPLNTGACNAQGQFIMSPSAGGGEKEFSQCSIGNMCTLLSKRVGKVDTSCLVEPDPAKTTISLQMCGNGIVENGEDCDPGSGVESACCDVTTCKFKSGAVCDPGSSLCCTDTCTFAPATKVCRPAKDPKCDTAETCTGTSGVCPPDVTAKNGEDCGSNGLKCASGLCTSIGQQCQQASAGTTMNLTEACPTIVDKSCRLLCKDPNNFSTCINMLANMVDGSPCGFGGYCNQGKCETGNWIEAIKGWYRSTQLAITIPVTIGVGLLVLLILYSIIKCIFAPCCRRRPDPPPSYATTVGHPVFSVPLQNMDANKPYRNTPPTARTEYSRLHD